MKEVINMSNIKDFAVSVELYANESEKKKGVSKDRFTVNIPKDKYAGKIRRITAVEDEKERENELCKLQFKVKSAALDQIRNSIGNEGILVAYMENAI